MEEKIKLNQQPHMSLLIEGRQYSSMQCKWNNKYSNKKKNHFYPSKRYNHSAVIYNNYMYLFGGSEKPKSFEQSKDCIYKLDLDTWDWEKITSPKQPMNRDSHGCCVVNNRMVIFGGSDQETVFNDLWEFQFQSQNWTELQQKGIKPEERDFCELQTFNEQTILLVGGMNIQLKKIYFQIHSYSLRTNTWQLLTLMNAPFARIGMTISDCKDRFFLFGGYELSAQQRFLNDLYELQINLQQNKVLFHQIQSKIKPSGRMSHGMIGVGDNAFLIIGGEGQKQQAQQKDKQKDKNKQKWEQDINAKYDAWLFNVTDKTWKQLSIKGAHLRSRMAFSICRKTNHIFLFGGMRTNTHLFDQLMILSFQQEQQRPVQQTCRVCINHQQQQKQKQQTREVQRYSSVIPTMSNNFIYNIALLQHFAFNAIGLIIDSAVMMKAQNVRVAIKKRISQLSYIAIEYSGNHLSDNQFVEFMGNSQITKNHIDEYANNIKLGSLRLGRTFMYINRQQNIVRVSLFSVNSNIVPNCQTKYRYFGYIQNQTTKKFISENGKQNKQHIINFLKSQVQNYQQLVKQSHNHSIYIFQMNLIMTSKNIYYYELITNSTNDIRILVNHRKIQFLDELGYNVSQQPDISLKSYLSLLYLNQPIKIYLNESTTPIELFNYEQHLDEVSKKQLIEKVKDISMNEIKSAQLYRVNQLQELSQTNYGILIYYSGRLIMRYKTEFGKLFSDKFYKNKYKKKRFHLFSVLGVIQLNPTFLKTNIIKTDIQNNQFSIPFWSRLKMFLKQNKPILYRAPLDSYQEDNVTKKFKLL